MQSENFDIRFKKQLVSIYKNLLNPISMNYASAWTYFSSNKVLFFMSAQAV
jgi:hypothetical protein